MQTSTKFIGSVLSLALMVALIAGVFITGHLWLCSLVLVAVIVGYRVMYIGGDADPFYVGLWVAYSMSGVALSLLVYLLTGPSTVYLVSFFFAYFLVCLRPSQSGV